MQYSIVNYKTVKENSDFRIDAEYFWPDFLKTEEVIKKSNYQSIKWFSSDIRYGLNIEPIYTEEGINFIRAQNLKEYGIDGEILKIPLTQDEVGNKNFLKNGDLLIVRSGANVGDIGIVTNKFDKSTFGSYVIKFDLKDKINPFYVYVFLKTKYGRNQTVRFRSGTAQPNISIPNLNQILISVLSKKFQSIIEDIFFKSEIKIEESYNLYSQAEELLLSELGLLDWQSKHTLTFVKNFSDTQKAERMDAEYFQPKYEEIIEAVKRYKGGFDTLENLTDLVGHPSNPPYETKNTENKTFIITQKHLANYFSTDNFWKDEEALYTTDEFIEKNKKFLLQKNDIILYSVGAYIGKANLYNAEIKATIGSFLTLIRPKAKKINPFYLLVFLNSKIGQELTRRNSRGLAQQYIYPYDTKQIIIPILEPEKQKEIENLIVEGQNNQSLSKSLLEIAKRGVEIAIEKDEQEAEKWIEKKLKGEKMEI